ncbi:MAG TPA: class I SAM-dependent methyltransferase [Magnetospirillaceae bacterium]|nr:class I SAM-dependent methyltransferase [Magnetospirillaceae bacterium]
MNWYESLFENYGRKYDSESFTRGTLGECDFIESELGGDRSLCILDIGCGTGRHAIELAARGYRVTGIDLSTSQLERAREKAKERGVTVEFLRMDARSLPFEGDFDAAVMLCEGAFPLMETDEMNYEIILRASRALRAGGIFLFTTLNGLFPLRHSIEKFHASMSEPGDAVYRGNTFNLMTFRDRNVTEVVDDLGVSKTLECEERYYVPSEISWLLKTAGFTDIGIYGARLGAFSRNDPLTQDDFEMLVAARKIRPPVG